MFPLSAPPVAEVLVTTDFDVVVISCVTFDEVEDDEELVEADVIIGFVTTGVVVTAGVVTTGVDPETPECF